MPAMRKIPNYSLQRADTRAVSSHHSSSFPRALNPSELSYPSLPSTSHSWPVLADGRVVYDEKTKKFKRPRNAFIFFRSHLNNLPTDDWRLDQNGLSRRAGDLWEQMSTEEKAPFFRMADEESAWYARNIPEYTSKVTQGAPKRDRRTRIRRKVNKIPEVATKAEFQSPSVKATWTPSEFAVSAPSCSPLLLPPSTSDPHGWYSAESFSDATTPSPRPSPTPQLAAPQASKRITLTEMEAFLNEWTTLGNSDNSQLSQPNSNDFYPGQEESPCLSYPSPPTTDSYGASPFQFDAQYTSFASEFSTQGNDALSSSWFEEPQTLMYPYYSPQTSSPQWPSMPLFEQ